MKLSVVVEILAYAMPLALGGLALLAVSLIARLRAAGFSHPRQKSPAAVRWGETGLWLLTAAFFLLGQYWQFRDYLNNPETSPALVNVLRTGFAIGGLASIAIAIAAACRWHRTAAALLLLLVTATVGLSSTPLYDWPNVAEAVETAPIPFAIETPQDLPPVTVSVNDVELGSTPIVTTWEDLKARTPDWKVEPEFHQQSEGGTLLWCPLSVHSTARSFSREPAPRDEKTLFFRYHLDGQPLYQYDQNSFQWTALLRPTFTGGNGGIASGSKVFGRVTPFRAQHSLTLPDWADDVQFLLHRARMMDYAVDDAWCEAFATYGHLGESALAGLSDSDPQLQRVLERLATRAFQLPEEPLSETAAWRRIETILDTAGRAGEFPFGGVAGATVRKLAEQLSDETLARRTVAALSEGSSGQSYSLETHRNRNGKVTLIRLQQHAAHDDGRWLRQPVLQELAVERDTQLDAESPEPDNPIETLVTPALMRLHRVGDGVERQIGGTAYERVLFRHDWRAAPDPAKWEDTEYFSGMQINRWQSRLVNLESRFGRNFRLSHQDLVERLAQDLWTSPMASFRLPSELHFLFLDHRADLPPADPDADGKRLTPAESFWRRFTERRPSFNDNRELVKIQWEYLARMSPDSRPEQFVDVLRKNPPDWLDGSAGEMFALMPADSALQTVTALLAELERQAQEPVRPAPSRDLRSDRAILLRGILTVDHPGLADLLVSELDRKDTGFQRGDVLEALREGRLALSVMQRLAEFERPEIHLLVAESGLYRTDPASRKLLERLSADADENVRKAAQATLDEWKEWRSRPLPRKELR
ncbi:hypothetical protein [Planctellipticum variicoloris]|uniref:hypothetical protein n=1 Tax=Planctellipticum variicoloris TaxID=3064265 RepID=UPI0030138870|nr:hypothetical protein SH412_001601 [Planctomycetaceae bacterium SH412]